MLHELFFSLHVAQPRPHDVFSFLEGPSQELGQVDAQFVDGHVLIAEDDGTDAVLMSSQTMKINKIARRIASNHILLLATQKHPLTLCLYQSQKQ